MDEQRWQDGVTTLVGIFVFLAPGFIPYLFSVSTAEGAVAWSHHGVGAAITVIGIAALSRNRLWEEWVEIVLGAWLIVSPWLLGFTDMTELAWSSVIAGTAVVVLSTSVLSGGRGPTRAR